MKAIPGFNNYRISADGTVWSCYRGSSSKPTNEWRALKPVQDQTKYMVVTLCENGKRRNYSIHRLLALVFIPNPENKSHVNHIDSDETNNNLDNLEWTTVSENSQHGYDYGRHTPPGEKEIVQFRADTQIEVARFKSIHEAGRQTGIAWQNISKVCRGVRPRAGGYSWAYA